MPSGVLWRGIYGGHEDMTAALRRMAGGAFFGKAVPGATVRCARRDFSLKVHTARMRALFEQVAP